jgi:hypothetical protein
MLFHLANRKISACAAMPPSRIVAPGVLEQAQQRPAQAAAFSGGTSWDFRVRYYRLFLQ